MASINVQIVYMVRGIRTWSTVWARHPRGGGGGGGGAVPTVDCTRVEKSAVYVYVYV